MKDDEKNACWSCKWIYYLESQLYFCPFPTLILTWQKRRWWREEQAWSLCPGASGHSSQRWLHFTVFLLISYFKRNVSLSHMLAAVGNLWLSPYLLLFCNDGDLLMEVSCTVALICLSVSGKTPKMQIQCKCLRPNCTKWSQPVS